MRTPCQSPTDSLTAELITVLDEEIRLLDVRRGQLEHLSEALIARDEARLKELLDEIEVIVHNQTSTDMKLKAVRNSLASAVGLDQETATLTAIMEYMTPMQKSDVDYRRQQIMLLADALRNQHLATAMLLRECTRINRMIMDTLFPRAESVTTYDTKGSTPWSNGDNLMDSQQ